MAGYRVSALAATQFRRLTATQGHACPSIADAASFASCSGRGHLRLGKAFLFVLLLTDNTMKFTWKLAVWRYRQFDGQCREGDGTKSKIRKTTPCTVEPAVLRRYRRERIIQRWRANPS
ncbi:MAG: hypothetical protein ACK55I_44690, partial [bacterium]